MPLCLYARRLCTWWLCVAIVEARRIPAPRPHRVLLHDAADDGRAPHLHRRCPSPAPFTPHPLCHLCFWRTRCVAFPTMASAPVPPPVDWAAEAGLAPVPASTAAPPATTVRSRRAPSPGPAGADGDVRLDVGRGAGDGAGGGGDAPAASAATQKEVDKAEEKKKKAIKDYMSTALSSERTFFRVGWRRYVVFCCDFSFFVSCRLRGGEGRCGRRLECRWRARSVGSTRCGVWPRWCSTAH